MKKLISYILCIVLSNTLFAQQNKSLTGKVYDIYTKEAIQGAVVSDAKNKTTTKENGSFNLNTSDSKITITAVGYETKTVSINAGTLAIALNPSQNILDQVVVTANKTNEKRSEAPIAITTISKQTIEDAKAQRIDAVLNKVSGVYMVNLGNEQHQMSIRQPMTTRSLFLYMEDGIPIRTTGVYNHNALLEMNLPAAKSIEVIKGPSSALFGGEAIGGAVNIITQSAPAYTGGNISAQFNNTGYQRADGQIGTTVGKWGILASGYYAKRKDGPVEHSDFNKTSISLRTDYKANEKLTWTNTLAYIDYYSDMTGALDSLKYFQKNFSSLQTFTFRSVYALRYKSILSQQWNSNSNTSISFLYRDNSVKQNPSYSIASTSNKTLFKGQINDNSFKTNSIIVQHVQKINWLHSKLIAGASLDYSPQSYYAKFISINKDTTINKYVSYTQRTLDSLLSNYTTDIKNSAVYLDYEMNPLRGLKLVAAVRYDAFNYDFKNALRTGAPSSVRTFDRVTPKLGFTYNYKGIGFYSNYSEGYVPPQITELFNSVLVPYLDPQTFKNYEIGGWFALGGDKLYADWSMYNLQGTNEIISVKLPDGSTQNQNAGSTEHMGIEYGINYKPNSAWYFRFSGTNAKHKYINNIVKGVNYNGKDINGAPKFIANAEVIYKPAFIKGFMISAEWQHQDKYFMDDLNKYTYGGYDIANFRVSYKLGNAEVWMNALNAFNAYYAVSATSAPGTAVGVNNRTYNMGDPRELTLGLSYKFGK
jgi:outer membrane receptor protein involved in Fe transport